MVSVLLRPMALVASSTVVVSLTSCRLSRSPVARKQSSLRASQAAASVPRMSSASQPFADDLAVAQVGQQFLQDRHLLGQLVRHGVAGALVAVIHFVAEGGVLQIEGHGHLVGLALPEQGDAGYSKSR